MRKIVWLLIVAVACLMSCKRSVTYYNDIIDDAELIASENPDSALTILEIIEPSELTVDSLKAKYHYVRALAHNNQGHLKLSDSLISFSADFYKDQDLERAIRSATLSALYQNWIGNSNDAIARLDSLSNLENVPDSLLVIPLRKRAFLGSKMYKGKGNREVNRRLITIDKDSEWQEQYKYWIYLDYLFDNQIDSAHIVLDDLINTVKLDKSDTKLFDYEYEKIGVLEELGDYNGSLELADKFLNNAPGSSIQHYLHLWKSLALLNQGYREKAVQELTKADSCASEISEAEKGYYNSFSYVINTVLDYQKTGKVRLIQMARVNNRQKDNLIRTQSIQQESEQSALEIENKRLILKAKNERQFATIIIIVLISLLITGLLLWYAFNRKRKVIDAEERAEVLQKMVDELKESSSSLTGQDTLRRAMLQQLGIIKMVAETPTEQNREMLRKLSSIENDTNGSLVNWENVYDIIDNLYSGFYSRLHKRYGETLTDKEEQIIVLMMAGFSTKEISVITSQTTAYIYVRKSTIRKKLGLLEKQDIMAFLNKDKTD